MRRARGDATDGWADGKGEKRASWSERAEAHRLFGALLSRARTWSESKEVEFKARTRAGERVDVEGEETWESLKRVHRVR